jgi:predicted nucleic acid-binding protein
MNVFVDANILVSVLNKEYPLFTYSSRILSLQENSRIKLFTSPVCLAIAFYFAEKKSGRKEAKRKIELLSRHIEFTSLDRKTVLQTLRNKKINDIEDGMEYYSALESRCKCIVTEDLKDFYFSDIEVLDSRRFFERYVAGKK